MHTLLPLLFGALTLADPAAPAAACLVPPVTAPIIDHFRDPCPYCPGNRGLEYGVAPGEPVRAMAAGRVSFSGSVAGVRYVVIDHADGTRATYGGLAASHLRAGGTAGAGGRVGTTGATLHVGLRRGDRYLDPEPLIGRLAVRPYLVPTDGTPRRRPPTPRLVCPAAGGRSITALPR